MILIKRLFLNLKIISYHAFIPFVFLYILIPILNYFEFKKYGVGEELYINILEYTQMLVPFLSVWIILFVFREYLESNGNEVLFIYNNKIKLIDMFLLFLFFIINLFVIYVFYIILFHNMFIEFAKMLCICFFYFGVTYSLLFATKSIPVTLMVLLIYTLYTLFYRIPNSIFNYYSTQAVSVELLISKYIPLFIFGIGFTGLGVALNKLRFMGN